MLGKVIRNERVRLIRGCLNISKRRKGKQLDMWNKMRTRKVGCGSYVEKRKGERSSILVTE
jgi:hypothetical protein